jgi:SAM-dependent methyltransferase
VPPPARVLEIGCGPGTATLPLARMGYSVVALEPAPSMAAIARRRLADYPDVSVEMSRIEDWPLQQGEFQLVAAGQAFHWVDPATGYPRIAEALGDAGFIAAFWNLTESYGGDFYPEAEELFRRRGIPFSPDATMGQLENPDAEVPLLDRQYFGDAGAEWFPWSKEYSTDEFIDLQRTHSHYTLVSAEQAAAVLDDLRALIDTRHGGHVLRNCVTLLRWLKPLRERI